jgi:hypothetical protein
MSEELNLLLDEYAFQILDKGGLVSNDFTVDVLKARQDILNYIDKQKQEILALRLRIGG